MEIESPAQGQRASRIRRVLRRFRNTEAGQALVEFTLILPIFLILLFAIVDFGRGFYTWLLVTNAAREGARVAAVQSDNATINQRIHDSYCDNYPSSCALDSSKLTISKTNVQGPRGEPVEISLTYDFEFVTPMGDILQVITGGNLTAPSITAHSSMRLE
jgi:hypothetical protein